MKKILAIVLSIVMLASVVCVGANAETGNTYSGYASIDIDKTNTFDPEDFDISLAINDTKIGALDGATNDFEATFDSIRTASGVSYNENPEAFFAVFTDENFEGASINVEFTVTFESDAVFGELGYIITIKGFSAPLDLGLDTGVLGGLLGGSDDSSIDLSANIPTDIVYENVIPGLPTIDASKVTVLKIPERTDFYDTEKYDPTGTELELTLSNGRTGKFVYNEENAHMFSFSPSANEQLSCHDTEVVTMIAGIYVMSTPINVSCKLSDGPVNITTYKYTESNPGYHAIVCEGCGETHDAQPHTPKYEDWTYNNDQTFVTNGTESNVCADCGTVLTRDALGTADFNTTFADMHFFKVIFEYINVLLRFIGAATE